MTNNDVNITMMPIGTVRTPFGTTGEIPKGPDAKHDADGVIEIAPAFEAGLQDIEGFSHLYILWHFHRVDGYDLVRVLAPERRSAARCLCDALSLFVPAQLA